MKHPPHIYLASNSPRRAELLRQIGVNFRQGWCLLDQELEDGVRSVAVPIRDGSGRTVTAINTSAHATRVTLATLRESFLPRLRECSVLINQDLASRQY